jgi:3-deoxy-D-manno-octulosonate 8-phosphate phosphatase (KDO 8-P phosphatase)
MLDKLSQIKAFIFDVDGVLTDGLVHVTETGEQLRRFSIKDGYALQLAVKHGFPIAIISGGRSQSVVSRLKGLGIQDIYIGVDTKLDAFEEFLLIHDLQPDQVMYMGDDIPDHPVMQKVGLPVCPADAAEEIKSISRYISPIKGGAGCVRDVIEKVLKVQDLWMDEHPSARG